MAKTDLERLVVQLSADVKKYENALRKAMGQTNSTAHRIEKRFSKMNSVISSNAARLGGVIAGAFAGGAAVRGARELIDTATRIENALKVAGLSGEELTTVYDKLYESAQRNAVPLESMAILYGRIAQAQDSLNVSQQEMTNFTDKIGVALRVAGTSAQEASGALLQLSQALGSGIVRAEEYNSINEGARPILQAVAAGLKEAGGSVATLRQLVVDGKVSSEAFFRAFEAGSSILTEKVARAELTVSQGFVRLQNVLVKTAGELNKATGASDKTGKALERLAIAVEAIGEYMLRVANGPIGTFIGKIGELDAAAKRLIETLSYFTLNDEILGAVSDIVAPRQELSEQAIKDYAARNGIGSRSRTTEKTSKPSAPINEISLEDYKVKDKDSSKGKAKQRADDYERLAKRIADAAAATVVETEAQRQLNPLIDDYGYAVERARIQQDLLNAAKEQGKEITPALRDEINQLAHQYATATVEAAKLAEEQDKIREKAEELAEFNKDLARGIIDGFIEGKDAADIFADALKKVGDRLINDVLDGLFQIQNMQGGLGGIFQMLGGLFGFSGGGFVSGTAMRAVMGGAGGLYDKGGYTGPGGKYQPAGVVHKGEYVFSKRAVDRIGVGNLEAMHRNLKGYAEGGFVAPSMPMLKSSTANAGETYAPQYNIDARGSEAGVEKKIAAALREYDRGNYQRFLANMGNARKRNAL
ncbi:tape measure protein [Nitratireductor kimnyeongensis]|uniref:Tape measure protein n=1 Tax=Nitratireductor kimnyeongensis TaxID=430679 RepID=A0ABW0T5I7_9HYPH|nr:tape measure protein [Nitratireductor kimnyeongensis]QZZ34584.1 tape measure protein [Nitratireductor kimnyeongensis]